MNRNRTTDEHSKTLRRVVAVLLALADLAERASGRSPAVRSLVLWLLRPGEVLARDYLAELTRQAAARGQPIPLSFTQDGATEAIRLAAGFRQLCAALAALAAGEPAAWPQAVAARRGSTIAATDPLAALRGATAAVGRRDSS